MSATSEHLESVCPLCGSDQAQNIHQVDRIGKTWSLLKCSCGLHRTDPCPTADDLDRLYATGYHSDVREEGGVSEQQFKKKYERYYRFLQPYAVKGKSLDVGCSTGYFVKLLKEKGFAAEGIEFNAESAAWGSEHYNIPIRVGSLDTIALPDATYGLISMTDVLEHTLDPKQTLALVHRALQPGGFALITFPDIQSLESRYDAALSRLLKRNWLWRSCNIPFHTWEFTPATARALFHTCGFEVVSFQRSQLLPEISAVAQIFSLPVTLLSLPALAATFGSQMEFILRKAA